MIKKIVFATGILMVCAGVFVGIFIHRAKSLSGGFVGEKVFHIESGEQVMAIAVHLEEERLVASRWYFLWSAWLGGLEGKIRAGDYVIPGKMTAPEVVEMLLLEEGRPKEVTITFPEGWDAEKMAMRLSANRFDGEEFLRLVAKPRPEWRSLFPVLEALPEGASLEGFLFPDTYTFLLSASATDIIEDMLRNFEARFDSKLREEVLRREKSIFDIVILASILEREIGTANQSVEDIARERGMVSDLFWRRIADNHPLESDATLAYARGESKIQHSLEDTRFDSPYNTYRNKGLPPGPISNPGLISLRAALFPISNDAYFFLNNPETGETFFAKTFEEHLRNKTANGL